MSLLDAVVEVAARRTLRVSALHVHHGLSVNADAWAAFCGTQCAQRGVPLEVRRVNVQRRSGESLEAVARTARYDALATVDAEAVLLAHHADDQAETVLIQLLRGAGPHGLAGMSAHQTGTPAWVRPLLNFSRDELRDYATIRGLQWIDDESNADHRFRRNFLRGAVIPLLAANFPGYPATLCRAASHQAEAASLLDELAAIDASVAIDAHGLDRDRLKALSPPRARNLLRWFLRREGLRAPAAAHLADMLRQIRAGTADARTRIAHDGMEIGCHRGYVVVHAPASEAFAQPWSGEHEVHLPGGIVIFERVLGEGVSSSATRRLGASLRSRIGGERMQLAQNRPRHTLKKLLQERGIPHWQRNAIPLLWCGDELAAVPGIGVAASFQSASDEAGWRIIWHPSASAAEWRAT